MDQNERLKKIFLASFKGLSPYSKDFQIAITKSLEFFERERVCRINYSRLEDEILYMKYYSQKKQTQTEGINAIIPLIVCNFNWEKTLEEVEKFLFFMKKDNIIKNYWEYFFVSIFYSKYIFENLKSEFTLENVIIWMKQYCINFNTETQIKSEIIEFQRKKINFLKRIDELDVNKSDFFNDWINNVFIEIKSDFYVPQDKFILNLSDYVLKLKSGQIKKDIYKKTIHPIEFINLNIKDKIKTSVLGLIEVTQKNWIKDVLIMRFNSKSGEYTFKFKKK